MVPIALLVLAFVTSNPLQLAHCAPQHHLVLNGHGNDHHATYVGGHPVQTVHHEGVGHHDTPQYYQQEQHH